MQPKKELKVQYIGIFEEIDSFIDQKVEKLIKRKEESTHPTVAAGWPHRFHIRPCTLHMTFMDNT